MRLSGNGELASGKARGDAAHPADVRSVRAGTGTGSGGAGMSKTSDGSVRFIDDGRRRKR